MKEILEILEQNSKRTPAEIAAMLGKSEAETGAAIEKLEAEEIIAGYTTLINWEKVDSGKATALIEVKVTPQRGQGFDKTAERISNFPEVNACYLMSGGYDLTVIIEGRSMREVALFVAEKLAPLESVLSTATHFVLRKYKDKGFVFGNKAGDDRENLIL